MSDRQEIALITGATEGIGRAFAEQLQARCKAMILVARHAETLAALSAQLTEVSGGELSVHCIAADLGTPLGQTQVLEAIRQKGPVSILINNAGFAVLGDVAESDLDAQQSMISLHCDATLALCRGALPYMREAGRGQIINLSSIGAVTPARTMATYVASKAFILAFSRALAKEEKRHGIGVQCLCPGYTRSAFHKRAGIEDMDALGVPDEAWATSEDVARASLAAMDGPNSPVVLVPAAGDKAFFAGALRALADEV